MLSKAEFVGQVAQAYEHLYDLVSLRTHPLADSLIPDPSLPRKERAWQLQQLLLDLIRELDPGPHAPVLSREWRRHRLMALRYEQGLDPEAVAGQLSISRRHYYREHAAAMEAVAGILWDRYVDHVPAPQAEPGWPMEAAEPSRLELLRLEAARMARADRHARPADVVDGVLSLLGGMLRQRGLEVHRDLPEALPEVSIDQSLLRQILLSAVGHLAEHAERATIWVAAQVEGSAVRLSITVQPPIAVHSTAEAGREQPLGFEEMAELSGAQILPIRAREAIVGFDVQLPAAERTVLVVDDNEDVLQLFQGYLSPHRYRVVTAQTAQAALTLARELRPDAITLDLMMPEQDGWDLLQVLLNQPETRRIPIVVCSVLREKDLALSLGATAFLEKPISEQALLTTLDSLENA